MALNFPDPAASPWEDPNKQVWQHNGDAWIRLYDTAAELESNTGGLKNPIINGLFYIWQRGAQEIFTGTKYCADRWITRDSQNNNVTTQRRNLTLSDSAPIGYVKYCASVNIAALGSNASEIVAISQKIEGVHIFAGKEVTLSYWAKTDSGAGYKVGVQVDQQFGTGGSASVEALVTAQEVTGAWTKYFHTFTLPDISSKTRGTEDFVGVHFWLSSGTTYSAVSGGIGHQAFELLLTGVQLELGNQATGFELRDWGTEISMCQRYFLKSYDLEAIPGDIVNKNGAITYVNAIAGTLLFGTSVQFPVYMREAPSVQVYAVNTGTPGNINVAGQNGVNIPASVPLVGQSGIDYVAADASVDAGQLLTFHYVADAELGSTIPI